MDKKNLLLHLRIFFCSTKSNIHRLYTEVLLNPFSPHHDKIYSKRFDNGVLSLVQNYNNIVSFQRL